MEQNGNPEIDPHVHGQILLDEDAKTTPWRKDCLQQMVLKKIRYPYLKTLNPNLTSYGCEMGQLKMDQKPKC